MRTATRLSPVGVSTTTSVCQRREHGVDCVGDGGEEMQLVFIDAHTRRFVAEGDPNEIYADLAEGREVRAYELIEPNEPREEGSFRGLLRKWTRSRRDGGRSERRSLARALRVHPAFAVTHVAPDGNDDE
jgi:hypothetical protein